MVRTTLSQGEIGLLGKDLRSKTAATNLLSVQCQGFVSIVTKPRESQQNNPVAFEGGAAKKEVSTCSGSGFRIGWSKRGGT